MLEPILSVVGGTISGLWGYLVAALAAVASVAVVYFKGKSDARRDADLKAKDARIKQMEVKDEIDEVDGDELVARLARWLRDNK